MRIFSLLLLSLLAGCGVAGTGDDDDSVGSGFVDLLLVVDNSSSMEDEQLALEALGDAIAELPSPELVRVSVTTTDIAVGGNGNQGNVRSLSPIGGTTCEEPTVVDPSTEAGRADLADLVDVGIAGSGDESGVLATALALCKAQPSLFWEFLDDRPDDDPVRAICRLVPAAERAMGATPPCNAGVLRDGAELVVAIVSDEGDAAVSRIDLPPQSTLGDCVDSGGDECACRIDWFTDFFRDSAFPTVRFVTVTPSYQLLGEAIDLCGEPRDIPGPCNPFGASTCSLDIYQQLSCLGSGGAYAPIQENAGGVSPENPPSCVDAPVVPPIVEAVGG